MFTRLLSKIPPLMAIGVLALSAHCAYAELPLQNQDVNTIRVNTGFAALLRGYDYRQPSTSICDYYEYLDNGFLCAIRPSRLDGETRDRFDTNNPKNRSLGYGYHAIMFPNDNITIKGVYIHFGGSLSRPFNPRNNTFPSATFLKEAADAGFIAIQLAYNNRFLVSGVEECNGPTGRLIDNCAGRIRRDKILGGNLSPTAPTPIADSIEHRLTVLVKYLESREFALPVNVIQGDHINWPAMFLGGHSQGAAQALYIGKYFGAKHVCMLAGSYDVPDAVPTLPPEGIADWFLDTSAMIPRHKVRAIVAEDDPFFDNFLTGYDVMSLVENWHWRSFFAEQYWDEDFNEIGAHGAAVKDPSFAELRRTACFTRRFLW